MVDEFDDLDNELEKLKAEISASSDLPQELRTPPIGDYWKRRLDEERILWEKRMKVREEEKKALEEKLRYQQEQLQKYDKSLKELEERLISESRQWEDRLKAKEMDLLLEKNRLLNEEKVKDIKRENENLLNKIVDLNSKIQDLKEDFKQKEIEFNERILKERKQAEEDIRILNEKILGYEDKINNLNNIIQEQSQEIEKQKNEYEKELSQKVQIINNISSEKDNWINRCKELEEKLITLTKKFEQERIELENKNLESNKDFIEDLYRFVGPLAGLIHLVKDNKKYILIYSLIKDFIDKIESVIEMYIVKTGINPDYSKRSKISLLCLDNEFDDIMKQLGQGAFEIHRVYLKKIYLEIERIKPQMLILTYKYYKYIKRFARKWHFLPIVLYGDLKPKIKDRFEKMGIVVISSNMSFSEVNSLITKIILRSVASYHDWERLKSIHKKSFSKYVVLLLFFIFLFSLNPFIRKYLEPLTKIINIPTIYSVDLPYLQPTNISFDGNSIWICDWFGQSIYKHSAKGNMKIERIFHFQNMRISAITWCNGYLWSVDSWEKRIYKHNLDEDLSIIVSFECPNSAPTGLASDGKVLWSCDSMRAEIYRHRLDKNLTVEAVYKAPGSSPSGLWFDGKNLWSIDSKTNKIYKHRMDNILSIEAEYIPPGYDQKRYNLSGITGDSKRIWICSEKAGKIYRFSISDLKRIR